MTCLVFVLICFVLFFFILSSYNIFTMIFPFPLLLLSATDRLLSLSPFIVNGTYFPFSMSHHYLDVFFLSFVLWTSVEFLFSLSCVLLLPSQSISLFLFPLIIIWASLFPLLCPAVINRAPFLLCLSPLIISRTLFFFFFLSLLIISLFHFSRVLSSSSEPISLLLSSHIVKWTSYLPFLCPLIIKWIPLFHIIKWTFFLLFIASWASLLLFLCPLIINWTFLLLSLCPLIINWASFPFPLCLCPLITNNTHVFSTFFSPSPGLDGKGPSSLAVTRRLQIPLIFACSHLDVLDVGASFESFADHVFPPENFSFFSAPLLSSPYPCCFSSSLSSFPIPYFIPSTREKKWGFLKKGGKCEKRKMYNPSDGAIFCCSAHTPPAIVPFGGLEVTWPGRARRLCYTVRIEGDNIVRNCCKLLVAFF